VAGTKLSIDTAGAPPRMRRLPHAGGALVAAGCVALAVASLALPSVPTYDPWAWIVFGHELTDPAIPFSTLSGTGWKPLPVLLTAPFGVLGDLAPSLWLVAARCAGLAAMVLAFRLAARAAGRLAGVIAVLGLLATSDWLRYLSAGNIEPVVAALLLGAIELHLRDRRAGALALGALAGLARPEVWLLVAGYGAYLLLRDRRLWLVGLTGTGMLALWILPDWAGSGDPLHTFHAASASDEPVALQAAHSPALELLRGTAGILPAPVWVFALIAVVLAVRRRERTALTVAAVAAAWALPTIAGTAAGYPAVPRYMVAPAALACVLAAIGATAAARLPRAPRTRFALTALLVAVSLPFAVPRVAGLADQASAAEQRAEDLASLWQAVDRARARVAVARLRPAIEPGAYGNALAWKLDLQLAQVTGSLSPRVRIAFVQGGAAAARLRARGASVTTVAASGPWRVLLIRRPVRRHRR
jgi:hypothetical protein